MRKMHRNFVCSELESLIEPGSFASYIAESLGEELDSILDPLAADGPAALHDLLCGGWSLEVECFQWTDGVYRDDNEDEIPRSVERTYQAHEQMAAYGLLILANDQIGFFENEYSPQQRAEIDKLENWRYENLLDAYQALVYATKMRHQSIAKGMVSFSELGEKGAAKKHAPMRELKKWTVAQYGSRRWKSKNNASHELVSAVLEHAEKIGARLSQYNAQRTIYKWLLELD